MKNPNLKEFFSGLKEFYKNNFVKIYISKTSEYDTGFFVKILANDKMIYPALIISIKCINSCIFYNKWQCNIYFENGKKKTIVLHLSKRKVYNDYNNKFSIIEIIKDDGLDIDSFFEIDEHIYEDNLEQIYSKAYFYSIYYSKNVIKFTKPQILKVSNDKIETNCNKWGPIINLSNNKIIGIQYNDNNGVILKKPIKEYLHILSKQKDEDKNVNEITLWYYKTYKTKTKIFGKKFVERYKSKLKIIFENEEKELTEYLETSYFGKRLLMIKLIGLSDLEEDIDLSYMFHRCSNLFNIHDKFKYITIKNITNINYLFDGCSSICFLPDISEWDISKVNDISFMFRNCSSLLEMPDISKWNTNEITNISGIFSNCSSLKSLPDISKWNTNKMTNMGGVFRKCFFFDIFA